MRKATALSIVAAVGATAACAQANAGGNTVSRNYQVGNFQQIEVAGPYDVEVRTGGNPGVSARGSDELLDRTIVEVEGDRLVIHPRQEKWWRQFGRGSHGKAQFVVTVPALRGATIAGSGDIRIDRVRGDSFAGEIAGSGGLNVAAMEVQSLKLEIAGSGGVKVNGRAHSGDYDIAGSGDVDAAGVAAQDVKVSIAGSGNVRAHASGSADVSIMGSGDVEVTGGAKCSVSKAGSGNVRCS